MSGLDKAKPCGKGPVSSTTGLPGLPFPLLSPAAPATQAPQRARCLHLPVGGLKPTTLRSRKTAVPTGLALLQPSLVASIPTWELSSGSSWNLLLRLEEILTMNLPSLRTFQHEGRQPREKQQGEEETGNPSHIPTLQRPADRHIPLGSPGPDIGDSLGTLNLQRLKWISLQA